MSKEKIIIRRAPRDGQHDSFKVLRKIPQDFSLSLQERGLLMYIMSFPDDWKTDIEIISKENNISENKTIKIINKLKKYGYCENLVLIDKVNSNTIKARIV